MDETLLQELAERLLGRQFAPFAGEEHRARLLPGKLPDNLPVDLPLPGEARLVGSAVIPIADRPGMPARGDRVDVVLDIPGEVEDIVAFFDRGMIEHGWSKLSGLRAHPRGGFSAIQEPPGGTYCRGARGPWLTVRVYPRAAAPADVRVGFNFAEAGPCARQDRGMPSGMALIPRLSAPPGVYLRSEGGGGGSESWTSHAIAVTDRPAAELEAHFARQLAEGGWTRRDGGEDGPLAWSAWTLPADGDWRGLLMVVEEPKSRRRLLHVRAELASDEDRSGPGTGAGWVGWAPGETDRVSGN